MHLRARKVRADLGAPTSRLMQVPAEAAAWAEGAAHAKTATREMQNPPEKVQRASLAEELKEGVWGKEGREWSCRVT